jgi:hypothetical protein
MKTTKPRTATEAFILKERKKTQKKRFEDIVRESVFVCSALVLAADSFPNNDFTVRGTSPVISAARRVMLNSLLLDKAKEDKP